MRSAIAVASAFAVAATAAAVPQTSYGSWTASIRSTGGSNRARTETVTAVYSNSELSKDVTATCEFQGMLNGEVINRLTCDPASFSYDFQAAGYDDGYVFQLTLTQTVEINGTNVTIKGTSEKFHRTCSGSMGSDCSADKIVVPVTTAVA